MDDPVAGISGAPIDPDSVVDRPTRRRMSSAGPIGTTLRVGRPVGTLSRDTGDGVGPGVAATIAALNGGAGGTKVEHDAYFEGVARARYIIRRTFRIFDEVARGANLEPLQHQALIQIVGGSVTEGPLPVSRIADRLDVTAAFASRLVQDLEAKGFVQRKPSTSDGRVILVEATEPGRECLLRVSEGLRRHVTYFHSQLSAEDRAAALTVMAFYVGVPLVDADVDAVMSLVGSALNADRQAVGDQ